MNKGLDLIQRQQPEIIDGFPSGNVYIGLTFEELEELEKELKALEIVKEKGVNVAQFTKWLSNEYNREINYDLYLQDRCQEGWFLHLFDNEQSDYILTQQEFDLLKEVLL